MFKLRKLGLFLAIIIFLATFSLGFAFAKDEFDTSYQVNYLVNSSGYTHVSYEIKLTNRFSNLYATQYSLLLKGIRISNIKAGDAGGPLKTDINQADDTSQITLYFNEQAVGLGKSLNFNLSYDIPDLATKNGQIWEINIPRISETEPASSYSITVSVPESFGKLAYISPAPISQNRNNGFNHYQFSQDQLVKSGINAVWGEFQIFDFTLSYPLENEEPRQAIMQIALPPDTAYQQISYESLTPPPYSVNVDADGNWLAGYSLRPGEKTLVQAIGQVKIFPNPRSNFPKSPVDNLIQDLLTQKYWEVDNPKISAKAQELKTVKNIYNFVVNTLNYDLNRAKGTTTRQGAITALENPDSAICMEFTDLFIALCRAAGIPAREINGFAYTTNEKLLPLGLVADILHSWPEYYDEKAKLWIPVDPTWEKTSGGLDYFSKPDLNHFAFVIHGASSESPASAGFHKADDYQKNIEVIFADYRPQVSSSLQASFKLPKEIFWGINRKGTVVFTNPGPYAITDLEINSKADNLNLIFPRERPLPENIPILPPFAKLTYNFELKTNEFVNSYWKKVVFIANGQEFIQWLKIGFPHAKILILTLVVLVSITFLIFLTKLSIYVKNKR